jgi:hypothetical protein
MNESELIDLMIEPRGKRRTRIARSYGHSDADPHGKEAVERGQLAEDRTFELVAGERPPRLHERSWRPQEIRSWIDGTHHAAPFART